MEKDEILAELDPFLETMYSAIATGWNEYFSVYEENLYVHSACSRASLIRDHILKNVKSVFDSHDKVNFTEKNRLCLMQVGAILLRFKKLNSKLIAANIPTIQAKSYSSQNQLPHIPAAVHLNVGYLPNHLWTKMMGIYLTFPSRIDRVGWVVDLNGYLSKNASIIELPFLEASVSGADASTKRLRVKEGLLSSRRISNGEENS